MSEIVVYTGPMFSRKTAFLLAEYERSLIAGRKTVAFKPAMDDRFGKDTIKSRNAGSIEAYCINDLSEILSFDAQDYFIDEIQFLKGDVRVIQDLANEGKNFYIAGLDMTAEGKPFAIMQDVLCIATSVDKRKAICVDCKCGYANHSYHLGAKKEDVLIGDKEYIPLCGPCWAKRMKMRKNE